MPLCRASKPSATTSWHFEQPRRPFFFKSACVKPQSGHATSAPVAVVASSIFCAAPNPISRSVSEEPFGALTPSSFAQASHRSTFLTWFSTIWVKWTVAANPGANRAKSRHAADGMLPVSTIQDQETKSGARRGQAKPAGHTTRPEASRSNGACPVTASIGTWPYT